jgi:cobaltochelatase CobS
VEIKITDAQDIFPQLKGKDNSGTLQIPVGIFDDSSEEDRRLKSMVPKADPYYRFPSVHVVPLLLLLQERDNALMVGPTGVGKTMLATQLAMRLNLPVTRLNLHGEKSAAEMFGYYGLHNPNIENHDGWVHTALLQGIQRPGIVLLDEWDAGRAEVMIGLQRLIEDNDPGIFLDEKDEFVSRHPDCIVMATANTKGLGDETGLYAGTGSQNFAQLNRFHLVLEMEPLSKKNMKAILKDVEFYGHKLKDDLVDALCEFYDMTLSSFKSNNLSAPLSVRMMMHFAKYFLVLGPLALELVVLPKLPTEVDKQVIREHADRMNLSDPKRRLGNTP